MFKLKLLLMVLRIFYFDENFMLIFGNNVVEFNCVVNIYNFNFKVYGICMGNIRGI